MKTPTTPCGNALRSPKTRSSTSVVQAVAAVCLSLAASLPNASAGVLFDDNFNTDTSADYATGGNPTYGTAGSLSIPGTGTATFTGPTAGFEASFGLGRALGTNVLSTVSSDTLTVSTTFSLDVLSSEIGFIGFYAGEGTSATTAQSPFGSTMPAIGMAFTPNPTLATDGMNIIGDDGASGDIVFDWVHSGIVFSGPYVAFNAISAGTNYTLTMDITRVAGVDPTYDIVTSLNGTALSRTVGVIGLDQLNQVGLRYYFAGLPSPNESGGLATATVMSIDNFSASVVPEPATSALVGVAAAFAVIMLRRRRAAFRQ